MDEACVSIIPYPGSHVKETATGHKPVVALQSSQSHVEHDEAPVTFEYVPDAQAVWEVAPVVDT